MKTDILIHLKKKLFRNENKIMSDIFFYQHQCGDVIYQNTIGIECYIYVEYNYYRKIDKMVQTSESTSF